MFTFQLTLEEKQGLKVLLPLLQDLSEQHPDPSIQEMASDLRIAIATHGLILSDSLNPANQNPEKSHDKLNSNQNSPKPESGSENANGNRPAANQKARSSSGGNLNKSDSLDSESKKPLIEVISSVDFDEEVTKDSKIDRKLESSTEDKSSPYRAAIQCLLDPLLPVRGHGLIQLGKLLQSWDEEAMSNCDMLLKIFEENIPHEDSYIYLAAVNGMSALAVHFPDKVESICIATVYLFFAYYQCCHP